MEKTTRCLKLSLTIIARIAIYIIPSILEIVLTVTLKPDTLPSFVVLNVIYGLFAYIGGIRLLLQHREEFPRADLDEPKALYASYTFRTVLPVWWIVNLFCLMFVLSPDHPLQLIMIAVVPVMFGLGCLSGYYHLWTETDPVSTKVSKFLAMLSYGFFYLAPISIQISILATAGTGTLTMQNVIFVVALIQTGLGLWLGIYFTYDYLTKYANKSEFWSHDIFDFRTLKRSTYLLYSLPIWVLCNIVSSWIDGSYLPWRVHLSCYCPIFLFGLGAIIGYAIASTCGDAPTEEEQQRLVV